ncbi:antirestriction protein [Enterobacter asburiae]|uniref:antirestriction protein n=1 Tax=Enterobacter asburiae TaxID=61645 RepID=UPI0029D613A2|nr:antirestriction protein [Enterobacter asburiae]MDX7664744.1 antirestriction protein [Enterobacter asburiae]
MHTLNVKTATRESAEQFKIDERQRYCVTDGDERLDFIPALFFTSSGDNMIASWLRQHSDYDGGFWNYWIIPQGTGGNVAPNCVRYITTQTGYIAPEGEQRYNMVIPGNYFEAEVSADAAGIISTLMIINWLSWQVVDMGPEYATVLNHLIACQDALKDYVSIIHHPERELIWRAID